jgi:hypothetical protein
MKVRRLMMWHYNYLKHVTCLGATCLVACLLAPDVRAGLLTADADTNIEEVNGPDDVEGALGRMQSRSNTTDGRQNISYVRFDLGGGTASNAEFSVITLSSTNWLDTQFFVYGLNDVAGNTPQNWIESGAGGLSYNTSGAEVPGDGDGLTQDLGSIGTTGAENLWDLGNLPENLSGGGQTIAFSSAELDNFLNSRGGGLATLLIVNAEGTNRDVLFATKETGTGSVGPTLSGIVPEPTSLAMALFGLVGIGCAGRRQR